MQYGYPKTKTHKPKKSFNNNPMGGGGVGLGLYRSFGCSMVTLMQKPINPKQVSTITLWGGGRFGNIQELWVQYGYPKAKTHKPKTSFNNNPMGGVGLGLYRSFGCSMFTLKQKPINPKQVSTITLWGGSVWDYTGALGAVWLP